MRIHPVHLFLAFCVLLGSSNTFPQSRTGTMIVGVPAGSPGGAVADHLARNMSIQYDVTNLSRQSAAAAARDLRGKATDGSVLMVVFILETQSAQGDAPTASEFSSLTPVAMLGEYLLGSGNSGRAWFGLFAPPGTPASVVRSLESQVKKALADPGTLKPPGLGGVLASEKDAAALRRRMAASPKAQRAATPAPSGGADDRPTVGGGASSN